MTTRAGFFQAILDDPDDLSVRLIFADWLEEHGNETDRARAELIRRQCRLVELAPNGGEWRAQNTAVQALLKQHRRDWNGHLHERLHRGGLLHAVSSRRGRIKPWDYRRGFVEALHVEADTLIRHALLLFQLGPIRHLKLWNARSCLSKLVRCPVLPLVETLDLSENGLRSEDVRLLASLGKADDLQNLYLTDNPIDAVGQRSLQGAFPQTRIHYVGWAHEVFPKVHGPFVRG